MMNIVQSMDMGILMRPKGTIESFFNTIHPNHLMAVARCGSSSVVVFIFGFRCVVREDSV